MKYIPDGVPLYHNVFSSVCYIKARSFYHCNKEETSSSKKHTEYLVPKNPNIMNDFGTYCVHHQDAQSPKLGL